MHALTGTQVTQLCLTLDALLESENSRAEVLECYFLEALYCSLGATLLENDRVKFDEFIKGLSCLTTVHEAKELAGPGEIPGKMQHMLPCISNLFDCWYYNIVYCQTWFGDIKYFVSKCFGFIKSNQFLFI